MGGEAAAYECVASALVSCNLSLWPTTKVLRGKNEFAVHTKSYLSICFSVYLSVWLVGGVVSQLVS